MKLSTTISVACSNGCRRFGTASPTNRHSPIPAHRRARHRHLMDQNRKPSDIEPRIAMDARDWIVRLSSGAVTDADLDRFHAWHDASPEHRQAFARERAFWGDLKLLVGASEAG